MFKDRDPRIGLFASAAMAGVLAISGCGAPKPRITPRPTAAPEIPAPSQVAPIDLGNCLNNELTPWELDLEPGDQVRVGAIAESGDRVYVNLIDFDSRTNDSPFEYSPQGFDDGKVYQSPGQLAVGSPSEKVVFNLPSGPGENGGATINASIECNWQPPA